LLRASLPDAQSRRGFNIAFGSSGADSAHGPGKDRLRDALPSAQREGFATAVSFIVMRNNAQPWAMKGAAIAQQVPRVAEGRLAGGDPFHALGYDIATGIFGDPALGGQGDLAMGPGKQRLLDTLNASGKKGFDASMKLHLGPPPLPRRA
jgi:hypothetical protein